MTDRTTDHDTQQIIEEFRANSGRVGGPYTDRRVLLLTTTAAAGGQRSTTPLVYLHDHRSDAEPRLLIVASGTAADGRLPAWYDDLRGQEQVDVEAGTWSFAAGAEILDGAERDRLFAQAAEADPEFAAAQAASRTPIPVVALTPVDEGPPAGPLGEALKAIHDNFRRELTVLRTEVAKAAADGSTASLVLQLRVNCMTLCQGLEFHHTGEDQMFPRLEKEHPELAEPLKRLHREHAVVADILARLRTLVALDGKDDDDGRPPAPGPGEVLSEVDRLVGELEVHLDYEEEHLVPVLNTLTL